MRDVTLIRNGILIDGRGGPPLPRPAALVVVGERPRSVGPEKSIPIPDGDQQTIDAGGMHILPGFIDAHVHLMRREWEQSVRAQLLDSGLHPAPGGAKAVPAVSGESRPHLPGLLAELQSVVRQFPVARW